MGALVILAAVCAADRPRATGLPCAPPNRYGSLVAAGFTTLLALQVFFNIGVVTNFLPSTGISLPFFSYGGTALCDTVGGDGCDTQRVAAEQGPELK